MPDPTTSDYRQKLSVSGGTAPHPRLWTTSGYSSPRAVSIPGSDARRILVWDQEGLTFRRFRFLALDEPRPMFAPNSGLSELRQRAGLCAQYY